MQQGPQPVNQVLEQAADILMRKYSRDGVFENPNAVKDYLKVKFGQFDREVFGVMLLDTQNRLMKLELLFWGTINAASVYPREVVKAVLLANAAGVVLCHNHPSGVAEPSQADRAITGKLSSALALIDVPVLDHIVVGEQTVSFAERGWL
ncbi:JAB domain-containing protein [Ferrimonas aestuarii]|uniref:MPN domain-containing protein n=1 Tax=Ferrimonas aestuarii TaxID=2569539 RepID=A0A4U1BK18_9GAMM|nr:JAB domain-containing protein [Ferrimonas aestuarii]TKB51820.1 hypothetical protein FCL42_17490 [Ferrimonas aestuarii]